MAVSATTRASLDFALEPFIGTLDFAWRMPKLFNQLAGNIVIERVDPEMTGAGKRKHMEWPIEFTAPFSIAAGGGITTDESESGTSGVLYPKIISAIAEIDPSLENTESGVKGMVKEAERKIMNIQNAQLPAVGMHHWWLDGSGRRARAYTCEDSGVNSRIVVKPMWAQDAWPGAADAIKYLVGGMKIDLGTADETAATGAGSHTRSAWTELRIVSIHRGTTIYNGADPCYIDVYPQIDMGQVDVEDYYIYITHPLGTLDGEPQGCARWIGNGYNARTSAQASGVDAAHAPFGWRKYAGIDRADVTYEKFIGYVHNMSKATPTNDITLTDAEVQAWLGEFYARAPSGTDLDVFVANTFLRPRFNTAFAAQGTLYLDNNPIRKLGWEGATVYDPFGANGGRWKPLYFVDDAWRQSIWGFSWKNTDGMSLFYQAVTQKFDFTQGTVSKYWTDLRPITKERILRAVGEQEGFLINLRPAASTAMFNVTE